MSLKTHMAEKQLIPLESSSSPAMGYDLICKWLGLEGCNWPPDYYSLLGIPRGEVDVRVLEAKVQERVRLVRCYQLSHSAMATEAMNHLARAFSCLCDQEKKALYDKTLPPLSDCCQTVYTSVSFPPPVRAGKRNDDDTVTNGLVTVLEWQQTTPPIRGESEKVNPISVAPSPGENQTTNDPKVETQQVQGVIPEPVGLPSAPTLPPVLDSRPADPVLEYARRSRFALQGLCSRKGLFERIKLTRLLRDAWMEVEYFCRYPEHAIVPGTELANLKKGLHTIEENVHDFPPILGVPGKPGYRVAILAMDQSPIRELQQMEPLERQALALDWKVSKTLLNAHLAFLQETLKRRRKQPLPFRWCELTAAFCGEHQLWIALSSVALLGLLLGVLLVAI